jgi:hypothetical protein
MVKYMSHRTQSRESDRYMIFPGFDSFEPTAPLMHAIFQLRELVPGGCTHIKVEFDERGAALALAYRPDGETVDVTLTDDEMSYAGALLTYISHQVITLSNMCKQDGDDAVFAAQDRLAASMAEVGLSVGLLEPACDDSVTVRAGTTSTPGV